MTDLPFKSMLFGGDYNPEQWPEEVWVEDMQILNQAAINSATINVFSWATIQPAEKVYNFETLDKIIEMLMQNNYQIVLATATGALPAWMSYRYPDVNRTDFDGLAHKFGQRHNACPNSPTFQKYSPRLAGKLAERYGHLENIVCWHISNEYGGTCYCENCAKAFRVWLKEKYRTISAVNEAWNMAFWGHTLYDWDEIVVPNRLSEAIGHEKTAFAGISIDYRRFMSDSLLKNYTDERDAIRMFDSTTPITTNLMGTYKGLDYFKWAREMDLVSWDSYPSYDTPKSMIAMRHDLMRGLKQGQPFMLMEQTPSQQNWQPYNSLKKPGQMRNMSYQAVAHGADTVQFFQLRRSKGACEKFHGAVIEHSNTANTRVFRETAILGRELKNLGTTLIGAKTQADVALMFDWDNFWALEYTSGPNILLKYVEQIHHYYEAFYKRNVSIDLIAPDSDLDAYKVVLAPVLYMVKDGISEKIEEFVEKGGTFLTTFMSGIVDQSDNVHLGGYPGPFRKLMGIWAEEIDALPPETTYPVCFENGVQSSGSLLCDIIHLEGAQEVAQYGEGPFYANTPAVTKNEVGTGQAYYVGTMLDTAGMAELVSMLIGESELVSHDLPSDVELSCREKDGKCYYFLLNQNDHEVSIDLSLFEEQKDLLSGKKLTRIQNLKPFDVQIVEINA